MKKTRLPICVRLMRWLFPVAERQRRDYRKCLHELEAQAEDLKRSINRAVKGRQ